MTFPQLLKRVSTTRKFQRPKVMVVLDPGNTTGWAVFRDQKLDSWGQMETKDIRNLARDLYGFLVSQTGTENPNNILILYEDYRVYMHKSKQHINTELHTTKLIGVIEAACQLLDLPSHRQMAAMVKPFCTDDKLKEWGYYQKGEQHANDAIRHGCYFLLFGYPE